MTLKEAFDSRHRGAMIKHNHFFGDDLWYPHIDKQKEYSIDPNTGKNGYGVKI